MPLGTGELGVVGPLLLPVLVVEAAKGLVAPPSRLSSPPQAESRLCRCHSAGFQRLIGASVLLSAALVAVYLPAMNEPLGTVPLGASELGLAALLALLPSCVEAGKAVFRRAGWTLGQGAEA